MIVDNFKLIEDFLTFKSEDEFYHLQILKRKKDCPEHEKAGNNNARCVKTYYIKNIEYLQSKKQEIIGLCEMFNARAYINLNAKSFEKSALRLLENTVDRVIQKQFNHVYRGYESVVGNADVNVGEKKWIIDIDTKDSKIIHDTIQEICKCQSSQEKDENGFYKNIYGYIPTVNGWHIITCPFNLKQMEPFHCIHPFDVQRNNPTLLYFNKKK